jgi:hypothetical protein
MRRQALLFYLPRLLSYAGITGSGGTYCCARSLDNSNVVLDIAAGAKHGRARALQVSEQVMPPPRAVAS